jgi:hypothetical protein
VNLVVSCIICILFFSSGCQRKSQKTALRCIYDQPGFAQACLRALADDAAFNSFKREPFYALLYQGHSYEEGLDFLRDIEKNYLEMLPYLDRLRTSDRIGNPQTYAYGEYGDFSPSTLYYARTVGAIWQRLGDLSHRDIVQIGAGYGALCKMLHDLFPCKSYTIVDLPEHLALARKVLEKEGISFVRFSTPEELSADEKFDVVISESQFSEFSKPLQKLFIEKVLLRTQAGYLFCHLFPKHFGVEPFSPDALRSLLDQKISHPIVMSSVEGERAHYCISWGEKYKGNSENVSKE